MTFVIVFLFTSCGGGQREGCPGSDFSLDIFPEILSMLASII
jgi:hypothetical protein